MSQEIGRWFFTTPFQPFPFTHFFPCQSRSLRWGLKSWRFKTGANNKDPSPKLVSCPPLSRKHTETLSDLGANDKKGRRLVEPRHVFDCESDDASPSAHFELLSPRSFPPKSERGDGTDPPFPEAARTASRRTRFPH